MDKNVYKKIDSINFEILSPKMIKDMASAKIVTPELYDKEGYPVDGGLMDVRLGVIDPGLKCRTCGQRLKECTGHFGYIELARPIIHIKFIKMLLDIMRSTCSMCGRVLIPSNIVRKYKSEIEDVGKLRGNSARRDKIQQIIKEVVKVNKCPYCNAKQKKIKIEKPSTFLEDDKRISPIEIRARLERITNKDLFLFGINPDTFRPEWAVLTVLPIPPVTIRPSITLESGERSEDDLTHKLGDILRINQRLFENINAGAPEIIIEDLWDLLQYHVTTFFDNNISQLPPARHRSGNPLKTLSSRIKSKDGRIRHNLAGKRTNFSARSVISPDPFFEINDVGVPKVMAMKLTIPERVREENIEYLRKFVENGPFVYPGANYIIRPDGRKKKITDETKESLLEELAPGFIVERHLLDGDIALFNRQPSLHRMSMMCHRVKVMPGLTFRLNPAVCPPYNADFDGDEMNLHIPQTPEAIAEAEILMQVQTQIISPRYGLSIIGCNQDAISGNYILVKYLKLHRKEAIDLLSSIGITDFKRLPNKHVIDGKTIFSMILPEDFSFVAEPKSNKPEDIENAVIIKNGILEKGQLDKNNLGEGSGLLLRSIHKRYGADKTLVILGRMYRLGISVLTRFGFSVLLSDIDRNDDVDKRIKDILKKVDEDVNDMIKQYEEGSLPVMPGKTLRETLEVNILGRLNKARNDAGNAAIDSANEKSGIMTMVKSGARGNVINIAQMISCVGQQAMHGTRINKGFRGRTLSSFRVGDIGADSRGFIRNSFKTGLKPYEMFFMAMTGRDSLMDTALRTPKSGYLYRRLANALQDIRVEYDLSVRDASGQIVQFEYGEDSVNIAKSENGKINVRGIITNVLKAGD